MASYPDEVLRLYVRLELLAKNADKEMRAQLQAMQKKLIASMPDDVIDTKRLMIDAKREAKKITAASMNGVMDIIMDHTMTAIDAAVKVEQAQAIATLGEEANEYYKNFFTNQQIYNQSMARMMPGLSSGTNYSTADFLESLEEGLTRNIQGAVTKAYQEGQSVRQLAAGIRETSELTYRQSMAAARTSIQGAANQARDDTIDALGDLVWGEIWLSTLDTNTCEYCQGLDGRCEPKGELPRPPAHPNCRCAIIAVPDGTSCDEMKEDMTRSSRDPETGKSVQIPYENYGDWIQDQDIEFQNEVLGVKRSQALRDGEITFSKMYTQDGSRKTLETLGLVTTTPQEG